ncbi:hypothetical protein IAU59_000640 [Kwoniella sp. CBS 9459]
MALQSIDMQATSSAQPAKALVPDTMDGSLPTPHVPQQCLTSEDAVSRWQSSPGFQQFWSWVKWRSERIRGRDILRGPYTGTNKGIKTLLHMLEKMSQWVDEVPPQPQSNQRFGNLAFRTYIKLVEERIPKLLNSPTIPPYLIGQLLPLLLDSHAFGHPIRIDYGTGHELAFVLALYVCTIPGWIGGREGEDEQTEEDELILRVFPRYLALTTQLQKTYRLEPAGSHGVWGLDDYCFLPYLFGSAQLLDSSITPTQSLNTAISRRRFHPSQPQSQLKVQPASSYPLANTNNGTSDSSSSERELELELEAKDMYTLSLSHLLIFKHGASFSEHSPLLYNLSTMKDWTKIHGGLRKMFLGEVVGKRVVVQGLFVGGWLWGAEIPSGPSNSAGARAGVIKGDGVDVGGGESSSSSSFKRSARNGAEIAGLSSDTGAGTDAGTGTGLGGNPITKAPWAR